MSLMDLENIMLSKKPGTKKTVRCALTYLQSLKKVNKQKTRRTVVNSSVSERKEKISKFIVLYIANNTRKLMHCIKTIVSSLLFNYGVI